MERVRRKLARDTAANMTPPGTAEFNPEMPWDSAFREAARDEAFWYENVDKKALMFATQLRSGRQINDEGIGSVVETGGTSSARQPLAKRKRSPSSVSPSRARDRGGKKARDAKKKGSKKPEQRPTAPRDASRKTDDKDKQGSSAMKRGKEDGRHFVDSSGSQLCWHWNHKPNGCADKCHQRRAHACEWCLSTQHRSITCQKKPAGWVP
jgi:hypothetical protein